MMAVEPSVRKSLTRLFEAHYPVEAFASAREFLAREPHPRPVLPGAGRQETRHSFDTA
jgi:FixJ family two-component response regulator